MKRSFGLIVFLLCGCSLCGCFATFDGARVQNRSRAVIAGTMYRSEEGNANNAALLVGVRSGTIKESNPMANIEVGMQAVMVPGNVITDEDLSIQTSIDVKWQYLINAPFDGSIRIRSYLPYMIFYPEICLALGKNYKGYDIYVEGALSTLTVDENTSPTTLKAGTRIPVGDKTAVIVEAGRSWNVFMVGLGLEF